MPGRSSSGRRSAVISSGMGVGRRRRQDGRPGGGIDAVLRGYQSAHARRLSCTLEPGAGRRSDPHPGRAPAAGPSRRRSRDAQDRERAGGAVRRPPHGLVEGRWRGARSRRTERCDPARARRKAGVSLSRSRPQRSRRRGDPHHLRRRGEVACAARQPLPTSSRCRSGSASWSRPARLMAASSLAPPRQPALAGEPHEIGVLHGDIHHGNILDFGARGWLAIDPKRLQGERASTMRTCSAIRTSATRHVGSRPAGALREPARHRGRSVRPRAPPPPAMDRRLDRAFGRLADRRRRQPGDRLPDRATGDAPPRWLSPSPSRGRRREPSPNGCGPRSPARSRSSRLAALLPAGGWDCIASTPPTG